MASLLPLELKFHIFESLVNEFPKMGPTLMCLSRYIQNFICPLFYCVMTVYTKEAIKYPSKEAVRKYGHHIRHLWENFRPQEEYLTLLKRLPLVRLSMYPTALLMDEERSEGPTDVHNLFLCFPQLTHLDLARELPLSYIPCLRSLPNLTYFSMYFSP
ncbi:hypothetical protein BDN72DRAFT_903810 [Pluteus cervinus]|uniref:Uncharacterized protein n=1 Tax=Pluteus cervinus TaxID=181527 RepID=A0ACD3A7E1_9AGAR|nr:hypothetical protein BDN72DRAFT_903810 [Pluteus cervinus]